MPELWARIITASTISGKQQQQHCWLYGKKTDTVVQVTILLCCRECMAAKQSSRALLASAVCASWDVS
jgi:hypothetical protein